MPCVQCKHFAVKSPDLSVSFLCVPRLFFHTLAHPFSTQSFRFFILARCDDYSNNAGNNFESFCESSRQNGVQEMRSHFPPGPHSGARCDVFTIWRVILPMQRYHCTMTCRLWGQTLKGGCQTKLEAVEIILTRNLFSSLFTCDWVLYNACRGTLAASSYFYRCARHRWKYKTQTSHPPCVSVIGGNLLYLILIVLLIVKMGFYEGEFSINPILINSLIIEK